MAISSVAVAAAQACPETSSGWCKGKKKNNNNNNNKNKKKRREKK
jgi:hypothetical protein